MPRPSTHFVRALISPERLKRQLLSIYTSTLGAPLLSAMGYYQASETLSLRRNATNHEATTTKTTVTTTTTTTSTEIMIRRGMEDWAEVAEDLASNMTRMLQNLPGPVERGRHWQAHRLHKLILASQPQFPSNSSPPASASTTFASSTSHSATTAGSSFPSDSPGKLDSSNNNSAWRVHRRDLPLSVGQLVRHKSKGYRAVVIGHTTVCAASPGWIKHHCIDALPRGRHQVDSLRRACCGS